MTELDIPRFSDILKAARTLQGHAIRTPLIRSDDLDERTGRHVFLKLESLQNTGSFKFRGAFNRLSLVPKRQRHCGVVAYSSGNHAQGVAYSARLLGLPATIVMPADAPLPKRLNTKRYGATVVEYDRNVESREDIAEQIAKETGATLVPPYEDPAVIAGQGTVGLEVANAANAMKVSLDGVLVCCGGGGLTAGCAIALKQKTPSTEIYTVEPENFNDTARSLAEGRRCANEAPSASICDALLAPMPGKLTFSINRRLVSAGLSVSDDEVRRAVSYAFLRLRLVLEPGGAVTLAAALAGKLPKNVQSVGLICSGGNIETAMLQSCLAAFPDP